MKIGSRIRIQNSATPPSTAKNHCGLTSARSTFFQSFAASPAVLCFSASRVIRFDLTGCPVGAGADEGKGGGGGAKESALEGGGGIAGVGAEPPPIAARISSRGMTFVRKSSAG